MLIPISRWPVSFCVDRKVLKQEFAREASAHGSSSFIGPTKSDGNFMIESKDGRELTGGSYEPFNLEIREAADAQ